MGIIRKVVDGDRSVRVADIERQPVDDNALIFLFQNKIFNSIQDEDTVKAIKTIMFLDAHLEPYKHRWAEFESKMDEINARFKAMKDKRDDSDDDIQFKKAIEWYRLLRLLMQNAGVLPRGSIEIEIEGAIND